MIHCQHIANFQRNFERRLLLDSLITLKILTPHGTHTLSISCTKSVILCKASIFFPMQGFKAVFFHHIVPVSDINYHNMVKKYCILMYTIQFFTWENEALHEITDFVHEMLSVCVPFAIFPLSEEMTPLVPWIHLISSQQVER